MTTGGFKWQLNAVKSISVLIETVAPIGLKSVGTYAGCLRSFKTKLLTPQNHWGFSDSVGVLVEILLIFN